MNFNDTSIKTKLNEENIIIYLLTTNCDIYKLFNKFITDLNTYHIKKAEICDNNPNKVYKDILFLLENNGLLKEFAILKLNKLYQAFELNLNKCNLNKEELVKLSLIKTLVNNTKIIAINNLFYGLSYNSRIKIMILLKNYCYLNNIKIILFTDNTNDLLYSNYTYIINLDKIQIEGKSLAILEEDSILNKLNFELPIIADLSNKLKFYGLVDYVITDIESLVNKLWN